MRSSGPIGARESARMQGRVNLRWYMSTPIHSRQPSQHAGNRQPWAHIYRSTRRATYLHRCLPRSKASPIFSFRSPTYLRELQQGCITPLPSSQRRHTSTIHRTHMSSLYTLAAVFKQSSVTIRQHTSIYNLRLHVLSSLCLFHNHLSSPIITILNNDLLSAYMLFLCSGVVKAPIMVDI